MANSDQYKTVYLIEQLVSSNSAGSILASSALDLGKMADYTVSYRLTARVYNAENSPVAMLQSQYAKKFSL